MGLFDDDGEGFVSASVAGVEAAVGVMAAEDLVGGLHTASRAERGALHRSLNQHLIQVALRDAHAAKSDQTCHPRTELGLAGITGAIANQLTTAGRFAIDHPDLVQAWRGGQVTTEQVCTLATTTRRLDPEKTTVLVDTLLPVLPGLSLRRTKATAEAGVSDGLCKRSVRWKGLGL